VEKSFVDEKLRAQIQEKAKESRKVGQVPKEDSEHTIKNILKSIMK
jgi:hypothetical protein